MTTASKPAVEAIHKDGYPTAYINHGTKENKPITSKRRLSKMIKQMARHRGRKHNHVIAERRRKQDLLRRDAMRGHNTPRIRAFFVRTNNNISKENTK